MKKSDVYTAIGIPLMIGSGSMATLAVLWKNIPIGIISMVGFGIAFIFAHLNEKAMEKEEKRR